MSSKDILYHWHVAPERALLGVSPTRFSDVLKHSELNFVEMSWRTSIAKNSALRDDPLFSLASMDVRNNTISGTAVVSYYRHYLASGGLPGRPLAIACHALVETSDKYFTFLRSSSGALLIPGGATHTDDVEGSNLSLMRTAIRESQEEIGGGSFEPTACIGCLIGGSPRHVSFFFHLLTDSSADVRQHWFARSLDAENATISDILFFRREALSSLREISLGARSAITLFLDTQKESTATFYVEKWPG